MRPLPASVIAQLEATHVTTTLAHVLYAVMEDEAASSGSTTPTAKDDKHLGAETSQAAPGPAASLSSFRRSSLFSSTAHSRAGAGTGVPVTPLRDMPGPPAAARAASFDTIGSEAGVVALTPTPSTFSLALFVSAVRPELVGLYDPRLPPLPSMEQFMRLIDYPPVPAEVMVRPSYTIENFKEDVTRYCGADREMSDADFEKFKALIASHPRLWQELLFDREAVNNLLKEIEERDELESMLYPSNIYGEIRAFFVLPMLKTEIIKACGLVGRLNGGKLKKLKSLYETDLVQWKKAMRSEGFLDSLKENLIRCYNAAPNEAAKKSYNTIYGFLFGVRLSNVSQPTAAPAAVTGPGFR